MRVVLTENGTAFYNNWEFHLSSWPACLAWICTYSSLCNVTWWPFFITSSSKKVIQSMFIYSQGRALTKSTVLIVSVRLALTEQDARVTLTSVF